MTSMTGRPKKQRKGSRLTPLTDPDAEARALRLREKYRERPRAEVQRLAAGLIPEAEAALQEVLRRRGLDPEDRLLLSMLGAVVAALGVGTHDDPDVAEEYRQAFLQMLQPPSRA